MAETYWVVGLLRTNLVSGNPAQPGKRKSIQLSVIWKKQVLKYKSLFSLCTLLYSDGSRPKHCGQTSRITRKISGQQNRTFLKLPRTPTWQHKVSKYVVHTSTPVCETCWSIKCTYKVTHTHTDSICKSNYWDSEEFKGSWNYLKPCL